MTYEVFLREHRLTLVGIFLCIPHPALETPYPPSTLDESSLERLTDELERLMPLDSPIADLRDCDIRLFDLLADDWFFGSAFGRESDMDEYASDLAAAFIEQAERLELDYDQIADPEAFNGWVAAAASGFIKSWRDRIHETYSSRVEGSP